MSTVSQMPGAEQPEEGWRLVVAFQDQSPSYANGFACGKFFNQLQHGMIRSDGELLLPENREMFTRIADHFGYDIEFSPVEYGWLRGDLHRRPKGPRKVKG